MRFLTGRRMYDMAEAVEESQKSLDPKNSTGELYPNFGKTIHFRVFAHFFCLFLKEKG